MKVVITLLLISCCLPCSFLSRYSLSWAGHVRRTCFQDVSSKLRGLFSFPPSLVSRLDVHVCENRLSNRNHGTFSVTGHFERTFLRSYFPEIGFPPFHEAHRRCRKRCGVVSLWSCSTVLFVDESSTLSSTMNRECVAVAFVFPSLFLFRNVYLLPRGIDR